MRGALTALPIAALAGASVWISLGVLAVTNDAGRRLGAVPSIWVLVVLIVTACLAAWLARMRTTDLRPLVLTVVLWLPWLPITVPPAFLAWEGPLESAIWVAALGGVLVARGVPASLDVSSLMKDPRRAPWMAAALAFACSLASAAMLAEHIPGGDEPHYLIITQSLLADGDLRIQNNHERGDYLSYHRDVLPPDFLRRGRDGEIYSVHAPGVSILLLPMFGLWGYPGAIVFVALLSAGAVALGWRTAYQLTMDTSAAWAGVAAIALSAPVLFHSFSIFPDPFAAVIVAAALWLLVKLETHWAMKAWHVAAVGSLLGVLPWLHTRLAIIAASFALIITARLLSMSDRWRSLLAFFAGPAISATGWFAYFWLIYGTPDPAAPYGETEQTSFSWIVRGLTGLAFDQQFGLLTSAPVMVFGVYGFARLCASRPRLAAELAATMLPYVLVIASFGMWWGGWSAPARFLVPLMPVAALLLAVAWHKAGGIVRSVFVALVLVGTLNIVARVTVLDGLLLYNFRDGYDLLLDWLSRSVNLPLAFPSVHRSGAPNAALLGAIWLGLGAMGLGVLKLFAGKRSITPGSQWTLTAAVGILAFSVGISAGWQVASASAVTTESSKADFIRRWDASLRPMAITLPELNAVSLDSAITSLQLRTSERARDVSGEPILLTFAWLPAADYRVVIEGASTLQGVLTAAIGTGSPPVETWPLDGVTAGVTNLTLRLPRLVRTLTVRGDAAASSRVSRVSLRPVSVPQSSELAGQVIRAARYGDIRAFFLDDETYVEPNGMWTRGDSTARMVLLSDEPHANLDLQAGPRPVVVALESGDWKVSAALAAGERRRMEIPTGSIMIVQTDGAFRPVDHDANVRDQRSLGVRLEFPGS